MLPRANGSLTYGGDRKHLSRKGSSPCTNSYSEGSDESADSFSTPHREGPRDGMQAMQWIPASTAKFLVGVGIVSRSIGEGLLRQSSIKSSIKRDSHFCDHGLVT